MKKNYSYRHNVMQDGMRAITFRRTVSGTGVLIMISMTAWWIFYLRFKPWDRYATAYQGVLNPMLLEPPVQPCLLNQPLVFDQTTYPNYTEVVVLNRDRLYHQGDVLTVKVVARDKEGRSKTYGGDFFRARLVSSDGSLQASSAGHVTDHCNGTYTVQFPLYWVGDVSIKIQLVHPSEAVKVLQSLRQVPNKRDFNCTFVDVKTENNYTQQCFSSNNPSLPPHRQCDFSKPEVNGTWICEKPEKLPCSAITKCRWNPDMSRVLGLVSPEEMKLFQKPYLEVELEVNPKEPIRVLETELPTPEHLPACTGNTRESGASLGHWSGKVWKSAVCNVRVFTKEDIRQCLANKIVYLQGDSTIRQWSERLKKVARLHDNERTMYSPVVQVGDNNKWNISVRYRFHHFPVQGKPWINFHDLRYIVDELDLTQGGPNTVIVLSLWAHFTAEPLDMIRSRLYAIRGAIHRLLRRSPGTLVFVRTGTTREHKEEKLEYYLLASDWLAYQITEVIREIFREDPDVFVFDTWDMSVCQPGEDYIHPDQTMVDNQLNRLFSHICPN
ncbi:NXPE family member 3-like isoform X1 [Branchiostoma floridae]|uniref:NXPE family member 3-like isoform X1 n=2 Tax=Branchiostoma floridae TaxID=7739 RepID=A0A9J7HL96_BRAFL|nr:NXPE family member 3-like isoform X1 [Branchiostoma floridae]